ncbi:MAG: hypothetical protein MI919_04275, partial [Holophagales bacterium]|nr:hypothetical protein [Holophagales bacterium]
AYRLYVESMMRTRQIPERHKLYIDEQLDSAGDAEQLVAVATHLLSELSSQVGVVLTPAADEVVLRSADFVPLHGRRVLCVLISEGGFVDNIVIETENELDRSDLVRLSNYVTENYSGWRLREIRDQLVRAMVEEKQNMDRWTAQTLAFTEQAFSGSAERHVLVEGTSALLTLPELADVDRIRRMLETFADKARLAAMLNQCLEASDGVRVLMGEDCDVTSELDFSLVATPYGAGEATLGGLGVIGPSRMEYPRVVSLVRYLGVTLSRALAAQES